MAGIVKEGKGKFFMVNEIGCIPAGSMETGKMSHKILPISLHFGPFLYNLPFFPNLQKVSVFPVDFGAILL